MKNISSSGFAIALAWPETFCKQAGAWYDNFLNIISVSKNHHYKVGHAAIILVNDQNGKCFYFDFGRYHAPYGFGRVRNEETDHDLGINTKAIISKTGIIKNLIEILKELFYKQSCHGTGRIHAAYCRINFKKAFKTAKEWQAKSPSKYGPFIWNGTNCSRFVRTIILSGNPSLRNFIRLSLPLSITPTPIGNVRSLNQQNIYDSLNPEDNLSNQTKPLSYPSIQLLKTTLQAPDKPSHIPIKSQWLTGEGAGSWFYIEEYNHLFKIFRYDPEGKMECLNLFAILSNEALDLKKPFEFIHLSHCDHVTINQGNRKIQLKKIDIKPFV